MTPWPGKGQHSLLKEYRSWNEICPVPWVYRGDMMQILKIGNICNNNCWNCSYKSGIEAAYDEILAEIERLDPAMPVMVSGGEPTINTDFIRIVEALHRKGFPLIRVLTNARAFSYPGLAKQINEYPNVEILVKILGHNEKIHDPLTCEDGSLRQTASGIRNLLKLNMKVAAVIEILEQNFVFIEKLADYLSIIGIRELIISAPKPMHNENYQKMVAPFHELKSTMMRLAEKPGVSVFFEDIPLCFLGKYKERSLLFRLNEPGERYVSGKCTGCLNKQLCPGIYKEYFELYSDEFLSPNISSQKVKNEQLHDN